MEAVRGLTACTPPSQSTPLAIVPASFVTVVVGAFTPVVTAMMLVIMVGAAVFVHIPNGIFVADGGWELVGVTAPPRKPASRGLRVRGSRCPCDVVVSAGRASHRRGPRPPADHPGPRRRPVTGAGRQ